MKVQLKVLSGAHAGKCVRIGGPEFVIGRGEGCNLRSNSDAISRRHCQITVQSSRVSIRDLGSRNGTFVNGQKVDGEQALVAGDRLTIGPLSFEVLVSEVQAVPDSPPAAVAGGPRPGANSGGKWDDDAVGQWLDEADAADRAQRLADPDTRIFKLDETVAGDPAKGQQAKGKKTPPAKRPPAKLPPKKDNSKDSQEAAAKMLRRLFNRGQ